MLEEETTLRGGDADFFMERIEIFFRIIRGNREIVIQNALSIAKSVNLN